MQLSFLDPSPPILALPPSRGVTKQARDASESGARQAVKCWTAKQSALLQLLRGGSLTRVELAGLLHWPISSVCSVLDSVRCLLEEDGVDVVTWPDGGITRRERFRAKR